MPEKKIKPRSRVVDAIQYGFFLMAVGLIRLCSVKAAYRLARVVGALFYAVDFKHRNRAVRHILHSGLLTDPKAAHALAKKNMTHMVKVFFEIIKFDQVITPENLREYIRPASDPMSMKMMSPETTFQIILATAHMGNWELAGGVHSFMTGIPMTSIMRPLGNTLIGDYFYRHRSSFQHKTVSKEKGLRPLLLAHKNGENITIVADQHACSREGVEVTFFGHPARAHATPALLHLRTHTPIAMPYLIRVSDDFHFEFHVSEPFVYEPTGDKDADIKAICQRYTSTIEKVVRAYPDQWLWAHRRWLDCGRGHDNDYETNETEPGNKTGPEDENAEKAD